ncbi:MAG: Asp-tRNA(Asn)/Glu-tRNA(Gln) amidotransferase subunit GatB [Chloroflexi bacterium]|nr:Asp-tRNA(Asn)/Glu-tRNA(Gln) amidotransferase subunit GatB [Chloroflexota bacterium]
MAEEVNAYEPVIGLEVHAELQTKSKMFCGCAVVDSVTAEPNTFVCPVCVGFPGVLPVVNEKAVEFAMKVGLALNCQIAEVNVFARKNYFYPDLPKCYQISQYELPLAVNGWMTIETPDGERRIDVRRVHLEEDTGKLFHVDGHSLVDFNRSGVPLLEIVSEPDMHSVEEVKAYAAKLRAILKYLGVNSGDMEKGVIRFEANVSVRPAGTTELRTRTEVKNLNSFRALVRSVEYEIERQSRTYAEGGTVDQETLGWDEARGATLSQRSKEQAHDYRYFPEPDLPPLEISREWVEQIRAGLPELPDAKRARFVRDFGLSRYDASVLVAERNVAGYFEQSVELAMGAPRHHPSPVVPKTISNWITGELFGLMNQAGIEIEAMKVTPERLVELIGMVARGEINWNTGKIVLAEMFSSGESAPTIVQAQGLAQVSDEAAIAETVKRAIADNPGQVEQYLAGKETVAKWLMGQVMRAHGGKANPQVVQSLLDEALAGLKK